MLHRGRKYLSPIANTPNRPREPRRHTAHTRVWRCHWQSLKQQQQQQQQLWKQQRLAAWTQRTSGHGRGAQWRGLHSNDRTVGGWVALTALLSWFPRPEPRGDGKICLSATSTSTIVVCFFQKIAATRSRCGKAAMRREGKASQRHGREGKEKSSRRNREIRETKAQRLARRRREQKGRPSADQSAAVAAAAHASAVRRRQTSSGELEDVTAGSAQGRAASPGGANGRRESREVLRASRRRIKIVVAGSVKCSVVANASAPALQSAPWIFETMRRAASQMLYRLPWPAAAARTTTQKSRCYSHGTRALSAVRSICRRS